MILDCSKQVGQYFKLLQLSQLITLKYLRYLEQWLSRQVRITAALTYHLVFKKRGWLNKFQKSCQMVYDKLVKYCSRIPGCIVLTSFSFTASLLKGNKSARYVSSPLFLSPLRVSIPIPFQDYQKRLFEKSKTITLIF